MAELISAPSIIEAAGTQPKRIEEYAARVRTQHSAIGFEEGELEVKPGPAVVTRPVEWVRYSTPHPDGADDRDVRPHPPSGHGAPGRLNRRRAYPSIREGSMSPASPRLRDAERCLSRRRQTVRPRWSRPWRRCASASKIAAGPLPLRPGRGRGG